MSTDTCFYLLFFHTFAYFLKYAPLFFSVDKVDEECE